MVTSEIYTDELLKKAMLLSGYVDKKKVDIYIYGSIPSNILIFNYLKFDEFMRK